MKAQDNIGELELKKKKKKNLTFEKDKEDKSKQLLSNPKPSALEIKWKNLDINVVE